MSILVVEHDMAVIRRLADHAMVLHHGERLVSGSPDAVLNDERVSSRFPGAIGVRAVLEVNGLTVRYGPSRTSDRGQSGWRRREMTFRLRKAPQRS